MSKKRGTSTAPIVLGIVGGVLDLPFAMCSGVCAGALTNSEEVTSTYLGLGIVAGILAIVFGCMAKKRPALAGGMLVVSTILSLVCFGFSYNFGGLIATVVTLIGAVLCFTQKKEIVEES